MTGDAFSIDQPCCDYGVAHRKRSEWESACGEKHEVLGQSQEGIRSPKFCQRQHFCIPEGCLEDQK